MNELFNAYELRRLNDEFIIYEKASQIEIGKFTNASIASKIITNLRNGLGFQGFTPSFITKQAKISIR